MKLAELLYETTVVVGQPPPSNPRTIIAYHGSSVPIKKFNTKFSAQGVLWFSEDKDKILRGESGAVSSKFLMTCELTVDKTADWDDYEKFMMAQLKSWGYDSIQLEEDWIVFNPKRVKVLKIEQTKPTV